MMFSLNSCSPLVEFQDLVHLAFGELAEVPDFRKRRGRQHDLAGVLALIVVGLASDRNRRFQRYPRARTPRCPGKAEVNGVAPATSRRQKSVDRPMRGGRLDVTMCMLGLRGTLRAQDDDRWLGT